MAMLSVVPLFEFMNPLSYCLNAFEWFGRKDGVYFMVRNRLSGKGLSSLTEGRLKRERTPASEVCKAWSHPSLGFRYQCSIPADRVCTPSARQVLRINRLAWAALYFYELPSQRSCGCRCLR